MSCPISLQDVVKSQLCTGCGACAAVSDGRIVMRETLSSNQRPDFQVADALAQDAGFASICPVSGENEKQAAHDLSASDLEQAFGPIIEVYEAYASDAEIRFKGSSGGVVTALALAGLAQSSISGVLHVRAADDDPRLNVATISRDKAAVCAATGSRYAPASIGEKLPEIAQEKGQVVVIGKPCDIAGAYAVADHNSTIASNIAATISIFCAGTPSHQGTAALMQTLSGCSDTKPDKLDYRGHGWPGAMRASWTTAHGETAAHEVSYQQGWGDILQQYRQWRCYLCTDHSGELADLSVGDPWQRPVDTDDPGRSLVIVRSARGKALLDQAIKQGFVTAVPVAAETVARAQPNLIAAKGNAFGRALALKLMGIKAPVLRQDSFHCWWRMSWRQKLQSLIGTWKRIRRKSLHLPNSPMWLDEGQGG